MDSADRARTLRDFKDSLTRKLKASILNKAGISLCRWRCRLDLPRTEYGSYAIVFGYSQENASLRKSREKSPAGATYAKAEAQLLVPRSFS